MKSWWLGGLLYFSIAGRAAIPVGGWLESNINKVMSATEPQTVLVRLKRRQKEVQIKGYGLQKEKGLRFVASSSGFNHVTVKLSQLKEHPLWQLSWNEGRREQFVGKKLQIKGSSLSISGETVPKSLHLMARSDGMIDVIAELSIEEYLAGVLPEEMPALWPIEALKAQAIVSRTYTLFQLQQRRQQDFHVESTVLDQVYKHKQPSLELLPGQQRVQRALRETTGVILKDTEGQYFPAYYHADCGGKTEEPKNVWGNGLKLGTVMDESCPLSPHGRWQKSLTWSQIKKYWPLKKASDEWISLSISKRTPSGRVRLVQLQSQWGETLNIDSQTFRRKVGFHKIKSTLFYIESEKKSVVVFGQGHGHGVGMCQYGARFLAGRGLSYQKILKHYYPKAVIFEPLLLQDQMFEKNFGSMYPSISIQSYGPSVPKGY